jgi:hypothetical protein
MIPLPLSRQPGWRVHRPLQRTADRERPAISSEASNPSLSGLSEASSRVLADGFGTQELCAASRRLLALP